MNLFVYGVNNPVNLTDSTGHFPFLAITGAIGAVVGGIVGGVVAAKHGKNVWAGIGIGVAAGGLIGLGLGAAAGALLAGSATASTAAVIVGARTLVNQAGNTIGQAVAKVANKVSLATQRVVRYVSNTSVKASSSRFSVKKVNNDLINLKRVGSALKTDPYHLFSDIVDNYAGYATKTPINHGTLY